MKPIPSSNTISADYRPNIGIRALEIGPISLFDIGVVCGMSIPKQFQPMIGVYEFSMLCRAFCDLLPSSKQELGPITIIESMESIKKQVFVTNDGTRCNEERSIILLLVAEGTVLKMNDYDIRCST